MAVSVRVKGISESPTLALNAKVRELKSRGVDILNFTAGEPDFDTPGNVKKAAIEAIRKGFTKYTAVPGTPELRKAIAEKLKRENGLDYGPEDIIVTAGGKQALYNALMAVCNPGDEVIVPCPYWVTYPEQVKLCEGKPVIAEARKENGFRLLASDVGKLVTKKTKAIMLNSPNNPTGAVYEKKELKKLADIALSEGIYVISDEIYEHLVYEGRHVPIAGLGEDVKERTITVNGAAKTYAMTGWRIGWAAGPKDIIKGMVKLQSQSTSNPSSISQAACLEAITGSQQSVKKMASEFRKRRDLVVRMLNEIDGVFCSRPGGAFYAFPDVSGCFGGKARNSVEFATRLLEKARVATVPGSAFGREGHVRMSYACSKETIEKGIESMKSFVKDSK